MDWLFARIALFIWVTVITLTTLANVEWPWVEENYCPQWKWVVITVSCLIIHFAVWRYEYQWRLLSAFERRRKSFVRGLIRVVVGGRVGVATWIVAFLLMGSCWYSWGLQGLAVGTGLAKLTYIPYLYCVVREGWRSIKKAPKLVAL